jgi:hypothetical protein
MGAFQGEGGREVPDRRRANAGAVLLLVAAFGLCASDAMAAVPNCNRQVNDGAAGARVDPPVTLTPTAQSAQRQLNFDTSRDTKAVEHIVVTADRPLPPEVTPKQLSYDALLARTGDTLESADFPAPTFTDPQIRPDRKTVIFSACLKPDGSTSAGKYVGSFELSGPDGVSAASINVTVNLKDGGLFRAGLIFALIVSFLLLLLKDAAVAYPQQQNNWRKALKVPIVDLRWWAATLIALGGAFGILYAAYANDPAWGATGLSAAAALVGSAFAAVGGQSILTSFSTPS